MTVGNSRLTIGIDASRAGAEHQTGTERYSLRIIQEIIDLGVDQDFRLYLNQDSPLRLVQRASVDQRLIPFPRLWTHLRLSSELTANPVDALFIPAHVVPPVHPAATVVTIHDLGYLHEPDSHTAASRRYLDWSTRWSTGAANRVIAISESTKQDLIDHYHVNPEKIIVIYHGVDEQFAPASLTDITRVRRKIGVEGPFILFVGTIQPRKNLVRLVAAFDAIAAENRELHLVLAGGRGWKTDEIDLAIVDAKHRDRIVLAGHVPDDDLPALMSTAIAVTLPSLYEGFGLPVLEAMACGTPVLISNRGALPEIAADAAVIVDPTSVARIIAGLHDVMNEAARARRVECGLSRAAGFTWKRSAEQTLETILMSHESAAG